MHRPRDFAADAQRAIYYAHRLGLDIERAFPALPREAEPTG
jgi:hypothetical protein